MGKSKKLIVMAILLILTFCSGYQMETRAEEHIDRPYTGMDEEGNIYAVESESGLVDETVTTYAEEAQVVNFNTKGSAAVTEYTEAYTGNAGYTNGGYGADAAYLGTENGKVKFMLSGVVGYVNQNQVQIVKKSSAKSISHYKVSDGWIVHALTYNMNQTNYAGQIRVGKAPSYLVQGNTYYSYDGHYFYTDYIIMLEDYKAENRNRAVNEQNPYFNYFQYLPFRSMTSYNSDSLDASVEVMLSSMYGGGSSKLCATGNSMIQNQNTYGVNGLLMLSIAANESAWGTSSIAQNKNNLFGLNAVDSSPGTSADTYADVNTCIKNFAQGYMSKGYLHPSDWRYFGGFLGNKASGVNVKYASDPYWGEKAAAIAWNLDEKMGNQDQFEYTIGIKDVLSTNHNNYPIYMESNSAAASYQSKNQATTAYLILDSQSENGLYMIQSDGLINSSKTGLDASSGVYDFENMHAYIGSSNLVIVNEGRELTGVDAFRDVISGGWYYDYVKYVYDRGIMTGMNGRYFGVAENLKRAQFATIIYRIAGSPEVKYEPVFWDVPDGTFYTSAAIWAQMNDIITGYTSDGSFGGGDDITREQMATIMFRYAQHCGYDTSQRGDISMYPDATNVSGFASEAMQWASAIGLIKGDNGMLNPQGSASRVHCAAIITRFMEFYKL